MAVYTSLTFVQINGFLKTYQLGPLLSYQGITAGIENTNYYIKTEQGEFVLTLYEQFTAEQVWPYLQLLKKLSLLESYYPSPIATPEQVILQTLNARPAALFSCLSGVSVSDVSDTQLNAMARALAGLHASSAELSFNPKNTRGLEWMQQSADALYPSLSLADAQLLKDELQFQAKLQEAGLEEGVIHADLFKDNVLFNGDCLSGFLDFYVACYDHFLLDIAITLNDWCVDQQGQFNGRQSALFIQAYQQKKCLRDEELQQLRPFLRRASLRFWLSRLEHQMNPRPGEIALKKSPEKFRDLLIQHRAAPAFL